MVPPKNVLAAWVLAACCVVSPPVSPRALGQATVTASQIVFNHPGAYAQADLEAIAGVHPGSVLKAADFTAAAQRISDTGFFESVSVAVNGKGANAPIVFDLKPLAPETLLHAGFENFVWLSHDEMQAAVHAKVPLCPELATCRLPEAAPAEDLIAAALTDALAAKGVTATVQFEPVEPTLTHPERVMEFRVARPSTAVVNVHLAGVSTELVPYVQKSVNATAKTAYNDGLAGEQTTTRILMPLLDAGYLEAALTGVTLQTAALPDAAGKGVGVVVSATLDAGAIYHVGKLAFAGAPLETADAFAATATLHAGDLASRAALLETLAPLDAAYRRKGYADVVVNAAPVLDQAAHTVDYTVTVVPGEPYTVRQLTVQGLAGPARADYDRGWLLKTGSVYNPEYITTFLKNNTALRSLEGYTASYKAVADPTTHQVDLLVTFYGGGSVTAH